jgi:hypothetical protein
MTQLTILPLQWTCLPDLRDVAPLDDADLACIAELRDVLARHGRLRRFALHLVHKHFELAPHEVLVEYSDPIAREQRLRVEARTGRNARHAIPTTWMLDQAGTPLVTCVCAYRPDVGHLGRHRAGDAAIGLTDAAARSGGAPPKSASTRAHRSRPPEHRASRPHFRSR